MNKKVLLLICMTFLLFGCSNSGSKGETADFEPGAIDIFGTPLSKSIWNTNHIGKYVARVSTDIDRPAGGQMVDFSARYAPINLVPNNDDLKNIMVNFFTTLEAKDYKNSSFKYLLPRNSNNDIELSEQKLEELRSIFPLYYKNISENIDIKNIRFTKKEPIFIGMESDSKDARKVYINDIVTIYISDSNNKKHLFEFQVSLVNPENNADIYQRARVYYPEEPETNKLPYLVNLTLISHRN
ncbi:hypothetical protein [Paenibacillus sp. IITD108]|uniref:hypothetical protein n=1 Tax=Paenibacillus sp. IITD108 TaxID=3116649 RepID=UPI002F429EDA